MLLIVPEVADQVTPTLLVLVTEAVNWVVPEDATVVIDGVTLTPTDAESEIVMLNALAPIVEKLSARL